MYIHFKCDNCGKHLEIDERGRGMSAPCPDCSSPVAIPRFPEPCECDKCGANLLIASSLRGSDIQCPECRKMFHVSRPETPGPQKIIPPPNPRLRLSKDLHGRSPEGIMPARVGSGCDRRSMGDRNYWENGNTLRSHQPTDSTPHNANRELPPWFSRVLVLAILCISGYMGYKEYQERRHPTPYVEVNGGRVYYIAPATRNEAEALGDYLTPDLFDGSEKLVELSISDGSYNLLAPTPPEIASQPDAHDTIAVLAYKISTDVFSDQPVQINLCDKQFEVFASATSLDGAVLFLEATAPDKREDGGSAAYGMGYDHGRRMAQQDRRFGTYDHASTDYRLNNDFSFYPASAGIGIGSARYGDYVSGYEQGYAENR